MSFNFNVNSAYNITLYASAILGQGYNSAKVLGEVNFKILDDKTNMRIKHSQVISELPVGTNTNAEQLVYLKLELEDGSVVTIAKEWISNQVLVDRKKLTIEIDNFDVTKLSDIQTLFIQIGINNYKTNLE